MSRGDLTEVERRILKVLLPIEREPGKRTRGTDTRGHSALTPARPSRAAALGLNTSTITNLSFSALLARRIREIAEAHDIPVTENPPLARALHGTVEIDQEIPLAPSYS